MAARTVADWDSTGKIRLHRIAEAIKYFHLSARCLDHGEWPLQRLCFTQTHLEGGRFRPLRVVCRILQTERPYLQCAPVGRAHSDFTGDRVSWSRSMRTSFCPPRKAALSQATPFSGGSAFSGMHSWTTRISARDIVCFRYGRSFRCTPRLRLGSMIAPRVRCACAAVRPRPTRSFTISRPGLPKAQLAISAASERLSPAAKTRSAARHSAVTAASLGLFSGRHAERSNGKGKK